MQTLSESAFAAALVQLTGTRVQATNAGPGTGSIFTLHLQPPGGPVCCLMGYCAWKLLVEEQVKCSWQDTESHIQAALATIHGRRVMRVRVKAGGDLILDLEERVRLTLFADSAETADPLHDSDYFLELPEGIHVCLRGRFHRDRFHREELK